MKKTEPPAESLHWTKQKEKTAGYWHVKFLLILFRVFPAIVLRVLAFPVGFFYFLFCKTARAESRRFLQKAAPFAAEPRTAEKCRSFLGPLRHIVSFSLTLVEKLESWGGKFAFKNIHFQDDDIGDLVRGLEEGRGAFLVSSHLGNAELLRGLASYGKTGVSRKVQVIGIVDTRVTVNFNRMLKELNPDSGVDLIGSGDIGADTAILLEEKLGSGALIAVAGDRTAAGKAGKNFALPFLGTEAPFSSGVFYLAALMNAPVYFFFALRRGDLSVRPVYDMHVHKAGLSFDCPRKERIRRSFLLAESYAALLERYCKERPFQWYNFYDFWSKGA